MTTETKRTNRFGTREYAIDKYGLVFVREHETAWPDGCKGRGCEICLTPAPEPQKPIACDTCGYETVTMRSMNASDPCPECGAGVMRSA